MSYDATTDAPFVPRPVDTTNPRDLEVILTLLEIAALELTPTAGATFTREDLFARALEIGGGPEEFPMLHVDLAIVFRGVNFLRREAGGRWSLK